MAGTSSFFALERQMLEALAREAKGAGAMALRSAGYHQHDRGAWRLVRKRGAIMSESMPPAEPDRGAILDQMNGLIDSAKGSRRLARQYVDLHVSLALGTESEMLSILSKDPVEAVEECYLARVAPGHQITREVARRQADSLRRGLLEGGDSPIERIMVDRAVACWLAVTDAELHLDRLRKNGEAGRLGDHKRLDHAQRRLVEVLKALDQVRRKVPAGHRLKVVAGRDVYMGLPAGPTEDPSGAIPGPPARVLEIEG